jgi:hypothetical protein
MLSVFNILPINLLSKKFQSFLSERPVRVTFVLFRPYLKKNLLINHIIPRMTCRTLTTQFEILNQTLNDRGSPITDLLSAHNSFGIGSIEAELDPLCEIISLC